MAALLRSPVVYERTVWKEPLRQAVLFLETTTPTAGTEGPVQDTAFLSRPGDCPVGPAPVARPAPPKRWLQAEAQSLSPVQATGYSPLTAP